MDMEMLFIFGMADKMLVVMLKDDNIWRQYGKNQKKRYDMF